MQHAPLKFAGDTAKIVTRRLLNCKMYLIKTNMDFLFLLFVVQKKKRGKTENQYYFSQDVLIKKKGELTRKKLI